MTNKVKEAAKRLKADLIAWCSQPRTTTTYEAQRVEDIATLVAYIEKEQRGRKK